MASILYGALVSDLAGKVGGQNFQRGLASPSIRNISTKRKKFNVTPVGNKIPTIRGLFSYVAASWRSLTPTEQAAWKAVTASFPRINKFGNSYTPSAYQLFVELNLTLKYLQRDLKVTAPSVSIFVVTTWSIAYAGGGGSIVITQSTTFTVAPYYTMIRATVYQSPGLGFIKSRSKLLYAYLFTVVDTSFDISSLYYAMFGIATPGTVAFFTVNQVNINTGEQGVSTVMSVAF